jgi:hypothetical protein
MRWQALIRQRSLFDYENDLERRSTERAAEAFPAIT